MFRRDKFINIIVEHVLDNSPAVVWGGGSSVRWDTGGGGICKS